MILARSAPTSDLACPCCKRMAILFFLFFTSGKPHGKRKEHTTEWAHDRIGTWQNGDRLDTTIPMCTQNEGRTVAFRPDRMFETQQHQFSGWYGRFSSGLDVRNTATTIFMRVVPGCAIKVVWFSHIGTGSAMMKYIC